VVVVVIVVVVAAAAVVTLVVSTTDTLLLILYRKSLVDRLKRLIVRCGGKLSNGPPTSSTISFCGPGGQLMKLTTIAGEVRRWNHMDRWIVDWLVLPVEQCVM